MPERNLDFDTIIERRGTDCLKYDFALRRGMPEDVLPLWVADMDFKTSSYVEDAVIERTRHAIFGYTEVQGEYFDAVAGWMKRHHDWEIKSQWLIKTPGVVFALAAAAWAHGVGKLVVAAVIAAFVEFKIRGVAVAAPHHLRSAFAHGLQERIAGIEIREHLSRRGGLPFTKIQRSGELDDREVTARGQRRRS